MEDGVDLTKLSLRELFKLHNDHAELVLIIRAQQREISEVIADKETQQMRMRAADPRLTQKVG